MYCNNLTYGMLSLTLDNDATLTATYEREKAELVDWVCVDATTTLEFDLTRTTGD